MKNRSGLIILTLLSMTVCANGKGENVEQEPLVQDIKGFAQTLNEQEVLNASGPFERLAGLQKLLAEGTDDTTGRYYFDYQSPLRSYPLNSTSTLNDTNMLRAKTADTLSSPEYTIEIQLKIFRRGEAEPLNNSSYTRTIPSGGYYLRDYREEASVRYVVQKSGAKAYGQYLIGSAIVDQQEHPELFQIVEAFLASAEPSDFPSMSITDSFIKSLKKILDADTN